MAAKVAHEIHPAVRARVVGLLADRLGSPRPDEPGRAADALLAIGPAALPPLLPRLLGTADPAARDRLVGVVAGVGGTLPLPDRFRLQMELDLALAVAGDMDAARAVAGVKVRLRHAGPAAAEASPDLVELVVAIGATRLTGGWRKLIGMTGAEGDPGSVDSTRASTPAALTSRRPTRGRRRRRPGLGAESTVLDGG